MRLSIFHSTSRALREFFLVLVQGYERAPRVSQLPNSFFLYADDDYRAKEAKEYYDGMTLADLNQRDKLRNDYYEHFTGIKRDDPKHYDMVVNVSKTGVEGAVAMILEYIKNKEKGE